MTFRMTAPRFSTRRTWLLAQTLVTGLLWSLTAQAEEASTVVWSAASTSDWQLNTSGTASAELTTPPDAPGITRVEITQGGESVWNAQVHHAELRIEAGRLYRLSFRARADQPRKLGCAVMQAHPPWDDLGLYRGIDLTPEWQAFEFEFTSKSEDDNGRVMFDGGGADVSFSLAEVTLVLLPRKIEAQPSSPLTQPAESSPERLPHHWRVVSNANAVAQLEISPDQPELMRVKIDDPGKATWHIQLSSDQFPIDFLTRYQIRFRARAHTARSVSYAVGQGHEPWRGLGVYRKINLTPEWQSFQTEFTATGAERNARLYFELGGQAGDVDISHLVIEDTDTAAGQTPGAIKISTLIGLSAWALLLIVGLSIRRLWPGKNSASPAASR